MSPVRNRVMTLVEMLEASAEAWWRLSSNIGQLFVRLEGSIPPPDMIGQVLAELRQESEKIGLTLTTAQIDRIREYARQSAGRVSLQDFGSEFRRLIFDLHMRTLDALEHRFFLLLDSDMVPYYKQTSPLFGVEVEDTFPQVSEDISEAGKCIALGRSTSAVFHLMRAMESVVSVLRTKLGVPVVGSDSVELEWGKILSNIRAPIEAMPKGARKKEWSNAFALLLHAKTAWRNPTMHPKQTYTKEQALEIFSACKALTRSVVNLV